MSSKAPASGDAAARAGSAAKGLPHRLVHAYAELTETERRVADFVMERPADLATFSARELAERSGVSGATVSRLVRRVGYASYEEARREARSLRQTGSPFHLFGGDRSRTDEDLLRRHAQEENRLIERTMAMTDVAEVQDAAAALAGAATVWFTGFRNSRFLADYARAAFTNLRGSAYALAPSGQTLAEGVAGVAQGDVIVAFGMRRRVTHFGALLEALTLNGAQILLIADQAIALPDGQPRWFFRCSVETTRALDSYAAPLAVTRMLALETMNVLGKSAADRLRLIETTQVRLKELE